MRLSAWHSYLRRASLLDELDTFFVHVPSVAWTSKDALLDWLDTPKGRQLVAQHLGWPRQTLVGYIRSLQGMAWSSLARTYR